MIRIIGAGLAGSEAAYYLGSRGVEVELVDMKPQKFTPAHESVNFGELVCSNSLKSDDVWGNACGLLKEEMRRLGSLTMAAAEVSRVPAGGALAVDREKFSAYITEQLRACPHIHIVCEEVTSLPERGVIATGPLTGGALYKDIEEKLGASLHFYDASAPIVAADSIDLDHTFTGDRYGKGTGDYINCPLTKEEYYAFVEALTSAERATLHDFEKGEIFEGCMPLEVMASRGKDTLRFGTFKPVGLADESGARPYAVLQLRKENEAGTSYNLVGCQTNLKFGEQKRVFSLIPALAHAEFERYGVMHRNTYLPADRLLSNDFSLRSHPDLFFAGQITGVEGYVESAMSGLFVGIHIWNRLHGKLSEAPEDTCVSGALARYISTENKDFQPMNANYGILRQSVCVRDKKEKKRRLGALALEEIDRFKATICGEGGR